MISTAMIAATEWVPLLDLNGARFYQSADFPEVYRRQRGDETRYFCDDDVVATLGEIAAKMNGWSVGDAEGRDD